MAEADRFEHVLEHLYKSHLYSDQEIPQRGDVGPDVPSLRFSSLVKDLDVVIGDD